MSVIFTKRLTKELKDLSQNPPYGVELVDGDLNNIKKWTIKLKGFQGTVYDGEEFTLQFTFNDNYPLESPEVIFINNVPIHPHIYSNGHICLSILYDQWSPALTISSICLSIQSMLSSCKEKQRPPDNDSYISIARKSPKETSWAFHGKDSIR